MMEWEPTLQASAKVNAARTRSDKNTYGYQSKRPEDQALLGKRAKWVDQAEMDARYREGRCLRCGRDNCRIERCPLAAPIRPANTTRRTQVNAVTPSRPAVTKAEVAEDDTSSHNDEDSD
ncbi:retrotransposon gag protein [Hirsutella rhossiliensis]